MSSSGIVCPECACKETAVGYTFKEGSVHRKMEVVGLITFVRASPLRLIICKRCGFVIKSYVEEPSKI